METHVDIESRDGEFWMREAVYEGEKALLRREVPVGCVFVLPRNASPTGRDELVGRGGNETNMYGNATKHAEIVAIDGIYQEMQDAPKGSVLAHFNSLVELLSLCELYVTCEPCIMCAGALSRVKIKRIHYGCSNDKFGGCGSVVCVDPGMHTQVGMLEKEAVALFHKFYDRENPESKGRLKEIHDAKRVSK
mmetsp:Transcript_9687/g.17848  ORF Transcript_9687/g.17848 Transcript_9687/m.17848 type:complete len:192 (-) Transcript_9687:445-1020(-)